MAHYTKDTQKEVVNYAGVFGLPIDETAIALINCCRYVHKDAGGEYVYIAVRADEAGNVYFQKQYQTK